MILIIKNAMDSLETKQALKLAHNMEADIVLLQNAVYLVQNEMLQDFSGNTYALGEDLQLRGIGDIKENIKTITYEEFVDLMDKSDKVVGAF